MVMALPIAIIVLVLCRPLLGSFLNAIGYVCPTHAILHILCPGCGCTRAFFALLRGDVVTSLAYNPAVLFGAVLTLLWYIECCFALCRKTLTLIPRKMWFWIPLGVLFGIYCVLRNLPAFSHIFPF